MLFNLRTQLLGLVLLAVSTIHAQTVDLTCLDSGAPASSRLSAALLTRRRSWRYYFKLLQRPPAGKRCTLTAVNTGATSGSPGGTACNTALTDVVNACPMVRPCSMVELVTC
ncbi:hypothetical protein K438DRAFT_887112 [Mycena galopus ATCC 62051]|nr:hypothetical protein K438DRAFT_887112 [Mycena galopus ATCC 62051]